MKKLWQSRWFWLYMCILAALMIAFALVMLGISYHQAQRGRAEFIPEVEALRPQRESAAAVRDDDPSAPVHLAEEKPAPVQPVPAEEPAPVPAESGQEAAAPEEETPLPAAAEVETPPQEATGQEEASEGPAEESEGPAEKTVEEPASEASASPVFDLASLQAINPDIVGWLTVDGTGVDFPVLEDISFRSDFIARGGAVPVTDGPRNALFYQYLYRDYLGKPSPVGSITVDFRHSPDLTDDWITIYGHNAGQSGVMLSDLKRFCEEDYCKANPSAVLWGEWGSEELRLLMVSVVDGYSDELFDLEPFLYGESFDRAAALTVLEAGALFPGERPAEDTRCVLLVTCYEDGRPEDPARLVLLYGAE